MNQQQGRAKPGAKQTRPATPAQPLIPNPARLVGLKNPAQKVRPVDWTWDPSAAKKAKEQREREAKQAALKKLQQPANKLKRALTPSDRLPAQSSKQQSETSSKPTVTAGGLRIPLPSQIAPAPKDAVYTISPEDARPKPRPLRLPEDEVIQMVGIRDVTFAEMVEVIADPEEEWTADVGRSDHFLKGKLCVQVSRAENMVIGVYSRKYALAVRPNIEELRRAAREATTGKTGATAEVYEAGVLPRKVSGGKGTRYPTDERELLQLLRAAGFEVTTSGSTHGKITHPEVPGLVLPWASSPSDRRHTRHLVTQVRRVFGIDVRRVG